MNNVVLITTSGIGERLGTFTKHNNKSLVKVGDKCSICYIIEAYDDDTEFIITLGYLGSYVKQFLLMAYPKKNFTFVYVDLYVGEGSSLCYSLLKAKEHLQRPFIFHCCDSIILDKIQFIPNKNILYVHNTNDNVNYASIIIKDNTFVSEINFKNHNKYDFIYTGISAIHNYENFWLFLENIYNDNTSNTSLSDVHSIQMMIKNNILFEYINLNTWYDTGNIVNYNNIKNYIKPKYNIIEKDYEYICFLNNKVIKFINDEEINKKRVIRGEYLYPNSPKILNYSENFIVMELIDGKLLSDVYNYNLINDLLEWSNNNLWNEKRIDNKYIECCKNFYIKKTLDRLNNVIFLNEERNIINGYKTKNIFEVINELPYDLITTDTFVKFHGDFILDNILLVNDTFKLLDWRHEFDNQLYYGDIYYELAKLRHNIIFNHNNILKELYDIKYENDEVFVDIKCNYFLMNQLQDIDSFASKNNLDVRKIKIITALIWLNMAPLYQGKLSEFLFYFGKYNLCLIL